MLADGGVNQQLSQVSDAIVIGHVLQADILAPELLVHHWWNDSSRLSDLIDLPHWTRLAAEVGVRVVPPSALDKGTRSWYERCGRKGPLPDAGRTPPGCHPVQIVLKVPSQPMPACGQRDHQA